MQKGKGFFTGFREGQCEDEPLAKGPAVQLCSPSLKGSPLPRPLTRSRLWEWPWPAECGRCPPVAVPDHCVRQSAWPPGDRKTQEDISVGQASIYCQMREGGCLDPPAQRGCQRTRSPRSELMWVQEKNLRENPRSHKNNKSPLLQATKLGWFLI